MATFKFELVSPERILFSGEVVSVIVPSVEGEMTILAGHAPLVAVLKPGIVMLQTDANNGKEFYVSGGIAEVNAESLTILAEQARFIEDVNLSVLDQEIVTAETRLAGSQDEAEQKRLAEQLVQLREFRGVFEDRKAA
ncbi:F0F1 ATP synthase subunit epsilon [Bosea sp. (in: a-proteobacteria)]|jgi:F-type H+-transporting ATPase subunit epsilon|uniref:F0F1 ATP synthase subunit epsilon n=1 Tax=Bosea sp. (in: a-proteobacteria) TaxID=1871050 RepID=UPI00086C6E6F|nr:F0F1 ATP synthase subunit epsilon [Bosea sp. (in: a-proteobacteria)]MBN9440628.1 F0F1 ATP synthase subunit epsilon [Bosea sp. (in: a-proteobacteria)]MBN9446062.1 F0F1 ATP synthase subunit epsilon [Bosea sp. (in: a-proteobacteria)]MBN9468606.1 F0F1 ATP synthase subunit epsilon [Bosea sp. (in: a-proteobacteria)]ODT43911.1 MAG: ATP synthase F1 subunit epsilon [Methylobacterium sp. SCN 67-24]